MKPIDMIDILMQLKNEVLGELSHDTESLESLGTPAHQLKIALDGFIHEVESTPDYNPIELTNRVLIALDQYQRLNH